MSSRIVKYVVEHLGWDVIKLIVAWVCGSAVVTAIWAWLGNLNSQVLACIQLPILGALGVGIHWRWRRLRSAPTSTPASVPDSPAAPLQLTESSLALLDFPILRDNTATYKLKVRPILRNDTTAVLVITRLQWRADSNEVPFQPPFAYRFQVEKEQGSWRSDSWLSEELSVTVRPGWAFRFWVGLTSNFEDRDIRQRHHSGSVGKAIITMRVNDAEPAQDIEIQL